MSKSNYRMLMTAATILIIMSPGIVMSSCTTIITVFGESNDEFINNFPYVYRGTVVDGIVIGGGLTAEGPARILFLFGIIDLPFILVADTIMLPYTIFKDIQRN